MSGAGWADAASVLMGFILAAEGLARALKDLREDPRPLTAKGELYRAVSEAAHRFESAYDELLKYRPEDPTGPVPAAGATIP